MNDLLDKAIALACKVHAGQVDKAGKPYILHPLRLMLKFTAENEMVVALLHDVVEDGDITFADLESQGFNKNIINAIECLTRLNNESYESFIAKVKTNALATKIKIEDLRDNMDLTRLATVSEKDLERIAKYHRALNLLLNIQ